MAFIYRKKFKNGDIPTPDELNLPYDTLSTSKIDPQNTKPSWSTRYHFNRNAPAHFANSLYQYEYTGGAQYISPSTAYSVVTNSGSPSIITINKAVNNASIIRVQTSGIIGETVLVDDGDGTDPTASYNCIGLRLLMTYNTGGGSLTEVVAECGYSFNRRSRLTVVSTGLDTPLWWRSFSFTGIKLINVPNFFLEKIELQAKVGPNGGAGNSVSIERNNVIAIISEH
jgi:hypothetical protein